MRKVISFELKKLVSRIGIYILVLLMAGLLVAGIFMYNPTERNTTPLSLVGETVSDMYANFNNDLKQGYIDSIVQVAVNANTYIPSSSEYTSSNKQNITALYKEFDDYCLLYNEADATSSEYNNLLSGIRQSLLNLKSALDEGLNYTKNATGYYILTTNTNYTKLYSTINKTISNFNSVISHTFASETYFNELRTPLYNCLQNLVYPEMNDTAEKYVEGGTYHALITSRMEEISLKMEQEQAKVATDPTLEDNQDIKNELNVLFNRYANCVEIFTKSYSSSMCVDALNDVTNKSDRVNLLGYGNISLYEQEELALRYQYYIENHSFSNDYANSLSITHTSNAKINAYDFTFFVMSLFAVVVIIYSIFLSAHTISGEINNNTMRFTAIRPVKRSSIFFGKYFAILIMTFILLMFGTITSLIIGGIMYGFSSANILIIFNTNLIFATHPIVVIGLFVISLFLISALYSALTIMLSTILKSELLTMLIAIVLYSVNLILPLFFGVGSWLRFYPLTNINIFAYFGSTGISHEGILAKLFNSIVYQGMNIWISLIYVFGITTILLLIGRHIFKKREL